MKFMKRERIEWNFILLKAERSGMSLMSEDWVGAVAFGWVMGAAAPMAPPKGADQPQQPNQMNQTKEREWNETKRKKAILFHESIN